MFVIGGFEREIFKIILFKECLHNPIFVGESSSLFDYSVRFPFTSPFNRLIFVSEMCNMWLLVLAMALTVDAFPRRYRRDTEQQEPKKSGEQRRGKALGYYQPSYMNNPVMFDPSGLLQYEDALAAALASATYSEGGENEENEILSRTRPGTKKPSNSPIYYIRLPPSPYIFIPGVGYVSNPPQIQPPPVVQRRPDSQFINVPVGFVSNGKPTGVYTLENDLGYGQSSPPKDSPVTTLDKGPYVFNGRPTDIYLLRDAYNSLYADALTNFYP